MYTVSAFIIASSLLTNNLYSFARNDSWFPVLTGFIVSLMIIGIYGALAKRYPGLSLVDINTAVFGKVLGKVVSILYVFYFLSLIYLNTRDLGDFIKSAVLSDTPMAITLISFTFVCAFAVRKGPAVLTRYGFLMSAVAIFAILSNMLLVLNITEPNNLLPAFRLPVKNYLIGTHIVTMLPFCEIISFMMFIPFMQKTEEFGGAIRKGLCIGAATLQLIVLRDITVLGQYINSNTMPTYSTIRMIDIGDILTRFEIVYAVILVSLLFYKVSVVYYATVSSAGRLLGTDSSRWLVFIFGALTVVYAQASFNNSAEHVYWNMTAAATYATFFLLILPLFTLIVSWIRARPEGQNGLGQEMMS